MPRLLQKLSTLLAVGVCLSISSLKTLGQAPNKDMLELQHYTLTMANVTQFWETVGSLAKIAKEHPELRGALETDADQHEDLAAMERHIASMPLAKTTIIDHGLTVHEFVLLQLSMFQSAMASALAPPGPERTKKAIEAGINPANVNFVDKHKAELEALQAKNVPKDAGSN